MKRILFAIMALLLFPAASQETSGALELAFHITVTAPAANGEQQKIEIAPKLVVMSGNDAEIHIGGPDEPQLTLKVQPVLGASETVDLTVQVDADLGSRQIRQKARLVSLLGHQAVVEIEDEKRGEKLRIEVMTKKSARESDS